MKSNCLFEKKFLKVLAEDNVAGGASSVFGSGTSSPVGSSGNQFPSQNDSAYAPGDARIPFPLGATGTRKNKKKKIKIHRRLRIGI
jgi:hypothetical protein